MTIRRTHLALVALLAAVVLLWAAGGMALNTMAQGGTAGQPQGAMNPWLQYQGRLTRVPGGEPVNGNTYLTFRLFDTDTGGVPLWSEIKPVSVISGLFTTKLGDVMGLDPHLFNGQALWLEVAVEGDPSVTAPRQEILPVAYALALRPGAYISDTSGEPVLTVLNRGAGDALRVDGDLRVSGDLIGGAHAHSGSAITTGIVAEPRIDPAIARDSEVAAALGAVPQIRYDVRAGSATAYTITIPHYQLFRLEMASDWAYTYGLATLEGFENDGEHGRDLHKVGRQVRRRRLRRGLLQLQQSGYSAGLRQRDQQLRRALRLPVRQRAAVHPRHHPVRQPAREL